MRSLTLNKTKISDESPPYVIAEIGHNHQGDLEKALLLIDAAAESGASAVKFQKRANKSLFTPAAYKEKYNSENSFGESYGLHREALEFGRSEYEACIKRAQSTGIDFFATAFDLESADFLQELEIPIFKIASGDITNLPLLAHVAGFQKPMIISTGGSTFEMIDEAVKCVSQIHDNFAILQCTASYPAEFDQLNLRVIQQLREKYPHTVIGYSGHDNGIAMSVVAYTLGARIVEKHFTLNRTLKGTDHAFSLEPLGMKKMVRDLKRASLAIGDGEKRIYESEIAPIRKMGKMIVAARNLSAGTKLNLDDLEFRSPALGLPPSSLPRVTGKVLKKTVLQYEPILLEDLA